MGDTVLSTDNAAFLQRQADMANAASKQAEQLQGTTGEFRRASTRSQGSSCLCRVSASAIVIFAAATIGLCIAGKLTGNKLFYYIASAPGALTGLSLIVCCRQGYLLARQLQRLN